MGVPLMLAKLALESGPLIEWLWTHRDRFGPVLSKVGDFATTAVTNPDGAARRVGNTILFGRPDGESRVIAFIEQAAPRLDNIEQLVLEAEGGRQAMISSLAEMQVGRHAFSASVASLQSLSMVSLGFTAILPAVLHLQFVALNKRLDALLLAVRGLTKKFDADKVAVLKTGVQFLKLGMDSHQQRRVPEARGHYNAGLHGCIQSVHYFHELLSDQLAQKSPNRDEVRVLTRHLSVAVLGAASCHVGLEDDGQAIAQIESAVPLLQKASGWVFRETVGNDPGRFLSVPIGQRYVKLAFMADLFRQANDAGIVHGQRDYSPANWFEIYAGSITPLASRLPWGKNNRNNYLTGLRGELIEAVASVEELNRVRGIEALIREVRAAGECNREVMARLREAVNTQPAGGEYVVWAMTPR